MKPDSVNQTLMVDYLLGVLPESDLELFESRFLQDESLFEELQEVEDELIDDYVNGSLSTEQQSAFERYFLRSSARREKLEFARAMVEHARGWKSNAKSIEENSRINSWLRPVPAWRQWAAIAAALLLAIGAGIVWLRYREARRELSIAEANATRLRQDTEAKSLIAEQANAQLIAEQKQTQELEDQIEQLQNSLTKETQRIVINAFLAAEYLVQGTRGAEKTVKTLEIPANAHLVRLTAEFDKSKFSVFTITLQRSGGATIWRRGGLRAGAVGDKQRLMLAIPADNLPAGNYELLVSGSPAEGDAELVGRYYLKVLPKGEPR